MYDVQLGRSPESPKSVLAIAGNQSEGIEFTSGNVLKSVHCDLQNFCWCSKYVVSRKCSSSVLWEKSRKGQDLLVLWMPLIAVKEATYLYCRRGKRFSEVLVNLVWREKIPLHMELIHFNIKHMILKPPDSDMILKSDSVRSGNGHHHEHRWFKGGKLKITV